jgi:hypothetical protein
MCSIHILKLLGWNTTGSFTLQKVAKGDYISNNSIKQNFKYLDFGTLEALRIFWF